MLINLRNALMSGKRLPYDAEVEFLQSTGTQYIDTGIPATQAFGCEITLEDVATPNYNCFIKNVTNNDFSIGSNSGNTQSSYLRIRGALTWANNIGANKTFIIKNGIIAANWAQVGTYDQTLSLGTGANSVGLFANAVGGVPSQCKIFSCKLYDSNGILVRDYIPVRKGTVGYLYDRVSGKLFGNAGTGDFVLGPDVVQVEYIESFRGSGGGQYINTGIRATTSTKWEIDIAFTTTTTGQLMGSGFAGSQRFNIGIESSAFRGGFGGGWFTISARDTERHLWRLESLSATQCEASIDGGAAVSYTSTFSPFSGSILLGKRYASESMTIGARYYANKIWISGDLVQNLLPVRVGNEGAMMDVLTRRIYRNAGSGAFTYGNDLKYPIPAE